VDTVGYTRGRDENQDGCRMKLYWRYKKNGSWTWKAATIDKIFGTNNGAQYVVVREHEEE
jgi:hypothetical protein